MIRRFLCLLLITGPCVTVMLNFEQFRWSCTTKFGGEMRRCDWIHPCSRTQPFNCCYRDPSAVSSFIEYIFMILFIPWHLFTVTIGCILLYSVDKIHPIAQVHTSPAQSTELVWILDFKQILLLLLLLVVVGTMVVIALSSPRLGCLVIACGGSDILM